MFLQASIFQVMRDAAWFADQRCCKELNDGGGDRFRQLVGQRSGGRRGDDEFVLVGFSHDRRRRTASMPWMTSPRG